MPCFSASNVRFISAQQQQQLPSDKERAKTAYRFSVPVSENRLFPRIPESAKRNCIQIFRSKGEDFYIPSRPPRGKTNIRPQYRQLIKSQPATLSYKNLERLQSAAKVITIEERLDALARQEELAKKLDKQAESLRIRFRKIDEKRLEAAERNTNKQDDLTNTAEKQKTLERAFIAKHEQEEEVKAVNRIILDAKCHAVRDAQVQEKHDIERGQRNEKIRLEKLVIDEAMKALAQEDCNAEKQRERNAKYAREIREQVIQRENQRFLEAERAEEQARVQRRANEALKREEERLAREACERRKQFRTELNRIVEMSNLFKKMLCEQEREADMRVAAYMREKREREKELQREKELAREEYERNQQRLYQLSMKIADSKSQRDEMSYIREQEQVEREYRRREKETAMRKKKLECDIKEARQRQLQETKSRQALHIAREERDFNILIDNLKKEEARLRKRDEDREKQSKCYRADIIKQMSDKAIARRRLLDDERTEAALTREYERQRLANIRAVINAKVSAMRDACLPERYIKDVERQLDRIIKVNPQQQQHSQNLRLPTPTK